MAAMRLVVRETITVERIRRSGEGDRWPEESREEVEQPRVVFQVDGGYRLWSVPWVAQEPLPKAGDVWELTQI